MQVIDPQKQLPLGLRWRSSEAKLTWQAPYQQQAKQIESTLLKQVHSQTQRALEAVPKLVPPAYAKIYQHLILSLHDNEYGNITSFLKEQQNYLAYLTSRKSVLELSYLKFSDKIHHFFGDAYNKTASIEDVDSAYLKFMQRLETFKKQYPTPLTAQLTKQVHTLAEAYLQRLWGITPETLIKQTNKNSSSIAVQAKNYNPLYLNKMIKESVSFVFLVTRLAEFTEALLKLEYQKVVPPKKTTLEMKLLLVLAGIVLPLGVGLSLLEGFKALPSKPLPDPSKNTSSTNTPTP
ncbi:MAG: hypothetical protein ACKO34_01285 [Vampirovibrionales bacterium]